LTYKYHNWVIIGTGGEQMAKNTSITLGEYFDDSFWMLAENPNIGRNCDEIKNGYRKFPQGSHVIIYKQVDS